MRSRLTITSRRRTCSASRIHRSTSRMSRGRWQESTDDRKTDLWVVSTKGGKVRRLTADRANARSPQWNPDGTLCTILAIASAKGEKQPPYDGKSQVWRISPDGKRPARSRYACRRRHRSDTKFLAMGNLSTTSSMLTKSNMTGPACVPSISKLEYGHGQNRHGQIWKLDLAIGSRREIIDAGRNIREFDVSPNGQRIAMITTPDDKVVSFEGQSRVDVWDAATGKITTIPEDTYRKNMPSPYAWLEKIAWARRRHGLRSASSSTAIPRKSSSPTSNRKRGFSRCRGPTAFMCAVMVRRCNGSPARMICCFSRRRRDACGCASAAGNCSGETGVHLSDQGGRRRRGVRRRHRAEQSARIRRDHGDADAVRGRLCYSRKGATRSNSPMSTRKPTVEAAATLRRLLERRRRPDRRRHPRTAARLQEGDKVPLVVEIHGGPTTATYLQAAILDLWPHAAARAGYAVLCPNYRGSTGYGDKFTTDLIGRENDLDVEDILKGVDAPGRGRHRRPGPLAVMGWCNGGYLTNCSSRKTTRFKAAHRAAPASSMRSWSGAPTTNPPTRWSSSKACRGRTREISQGLVDLSSRQGPHADADPRRRQRRSLPAGAQPHALSRPEGISDVPTELIVYPGEGHGIAKYRNRRAKMEWDLAWLDRYVMGKKK